MGGLVAVVIGTILATASPADAQTTCERRVYSACLSHESGKPDSTRGGVSASEFCAAVAIAQCS